MHLPANTTCNDRSHLFSPPSIRLREDYTLTPLTLLSPNSTINITGGRGVGALAPLPDETSLILYRPIGEFVMAALPSVPKVVRVDHHFTDGTDLAAEFRNFFQYTGTLSSADAATWLANIVSAMGTFMTARLSNALSLVNSELTDLTSNTAPQVQNSTGHTGGIGTAVLSSGTALVIKHEIARRYRGGHPRIYLLGIPAAELGTTTTWDPTYLGNVVGSYTSYIAACTANTNPTAIGTITHVNVSYFSGFTNHTYPSGRVKAIPTPRGTPLIDPIIALVGNPVVASQRRRNQQP